MSKLVHKMKNSSKIILKKDKLLFGFSHFYSIFAQEGDRGRGKLLRITVKCIYNVRRQEEF